MLRSDGLDLTIHVPADEWAYCQRRLKWFEAILVKIVRSDGVQEWYAADDLARLRLPGLPSSAQGITRKATAGRWPRQRCGARYVYHVSCLPSRSFDCLVARIMDLPEIDTSEGMVPALPEIPLPFPPENTAPAWVLPLMRLMKGEAGGNLGRAWQALPAHLPAGTKVPSMEEAAIVLLRLGIESG